MAGITPIYNQVVLSVYGFPRGFGINAAPGFTNSAVGSVYSIGSNVYNVTVGQKVGFKTECNFATDAGETYAVVDKDNIVAYYEPLP